MSACVSTPIIVRAVVAALESGSVVERLPLHLWVTDLTSVAAELRKGRDKIKVTSSCEVFRLLSINKSPVCYKIVVWHLCPAYTP